MIKPNLPNKMITKAIVSSLASEKILYKLNEFGINTLKLFGNMKYDIPVKQHPDMYITHCSSDELFYLANFCSIVGDVDFPFSVIEPVDNKGLIKYPHDVLLNAAVLGDKLICCKKHVHNEIIEFALKNDIQVVNVNQGYVKCNLCIVDDNSIITEDRGIANTLTKVGVDVLLLEKHCVNLEGYEYGFIGGASGKISDVELAFFGDIKKHLEYERIKIFLSKKGVRPVSLSDEPLTDLGSLIPIA